MWAVVGGFSLHVLLLSLPFSPDQKNPVLLFIIHLLLLTQKEYICYSCKFQTFSCVTCGKMIVNRARITLKFSHPIDWSQVSSFLFHYIHVNTTSLVLKKKSKLSRDLHLCWACLHLCLHTPSRFMSILELKLLTKFVMTLKKIISFVC